MFDVHPSNIPKGSVDRKNILENTSIWVGNESCGSCGPAIGVFLISLWLV